MKKFVALFILTLAQWTYAQTCWNTEHGEVLEQLYPGIDELAEQTFEEARFKSLQKTPGDILRIPIVVHAVYHDQSNFVSDEQIMEQIKTLNEDYQRQNDNASDTREIFLDVAGNPNIEFYLAEIDPDGNSTSGITRTQTELTSFGEKISIDSFEDYLTFSSVELFHAITEIKFTESGGIDAWDTEQYLNIWIGDLRMTVFDEPTPVILGIGYPPLNAPNWSSAFFTDNYKDIDGVVIHFETMGVPEGSDVIAGLADGGRTLTHEVGHYFGLKHIWGDDGCFEDDGLADTPMASGDSRPSDAATPCEEIATKDSCPFDALPDMIENFMDYSLHSCQNVFTVQQGNLMRSMIEGPREKLLIPKLASPDLIAFDDWSVFPNPADEFIQVRGISEEAMMRIYNVNSSLLSIQKYDGENIDIGSLAAGIYFIELSLEGEQRVKKFVVQR